MEILKTELVDDGAKQDRKGRRLMPLERITALVREYQISGLTLAAFARRAGVKYPTFAGWVYGQGGSANRQGAVRFARLQLPATHRAVAELSVTLADGTVIRGADVQLLATLVRALKS
jgi:hypothetical protein